MSEFSIGRRHPNPFLLLTRTNLSFNYNVRASGIIPGRFAGPYFLILQRVSPIKLQPGSTPIVLAPKISNGLGSP